MIRRTRVGTFVRISAPMTDAQRSAAVTSRRRAVSRGRDASGVDADEGALPIVPALPWDRLAAVVDKRDMRASVRRSRRVALRLGRGRLRRTIVSGGCHSPCGIRPSRRGRIHPAVHRTTGAGRPPARRLARQSGRAAGPGPTARSRKFGLTQWVEQPQQRKSIGLLSVGVLDRVRRAAQLDTHSPAAVHAVKAVERTGEQFAQLRFPG